MTKQSPAHAGQHSSAQKLSESSQRYLAEYARQLAAGIAPDEDEDDGYAPASSAKSVHWREYMKGDAAFNALLNSMRRRS